MRVVHINFNGSKVGGASIAMFRIIEAQRQMGIDSVVACRCQPFEEGTYQYDPSVYRRIPEFASKVAMKLMYGRCYSTGLIDIGMADYVNSLRPDVVQLNWIQGNTIGVGELQRIRCPIVWFLHDLWPLLGVEAYPENEWFKKGAPDDFWFNKRSWTAKRKIVKRLAGRICVVAPSEWAREQARESVIFKDVPCRCIHYPVNRAIVNACDRFSCEEKPRNAKFTILFGATTGISAPVKGWDRLMSAIDMLTDAERANMQVKVFGCERDSERMHGVDVEFLGKLQMEQLIPVYRAADLFAFPSRQETWGQTKTESLCCGTPVIAFDQTACANGIRHMENGWVAAENDVRGYAEGIKWFFDVWRNKRSVGVRNEMSAYNPEMIGNEWKSLYQGLLNG